MPIPNKTIDFLKGAYGDDVLKIGKIWAHGNYTSNLEIDYNDELNIGITNNYYNCNEFYLFNNQDESYYDIKFNKCTKSVKNNIDKNEIDKINDNLLLNKGIKVKDMINSMYLNYKEPINYNFDIKYIEKKYIQSCSSLIIKDITKDLYGTLCIDNIPSPHNNAINKFNNCLINTIDNKYIMLYRVFWKGNYTKSNNQLDNINSIWNNNPYINNTDWNFIVNTIAMSELTIDDNYNINIISDNISNKYIALEDPRIHKFDNKYFITTQGVNNNNFNENDCNKDTCIILSNYHFDNTLKTLNLENEIVCPSISGRVEKNWMMYDYNQNLYFLYDLNKEKIIKYNNNLCILKQGKDNELYTISKNNNNGIVFSGGTNSIIYNNDNELRIGLGHAKITYKYIENNKDKFPKYLYEKKYNYHFNLVYTMFFFIFEAKTGKITKITNIFIPTSKNSDICHHPYNIVFPMSIIEKNNNYIISYGEGDIKCKIMIISIKDVNDMMIDIKEYQNKIEFKYLLNNI